MLAFSRGVAAASIVSLSLVALLTSGIASAGPIHKPVHRKISGLAPRPVDRSDELPMSAAAPVGSENRYYSDTIASGHTDLMDNAFRYGASRPPHDDSADPLFRF